MKNSKKLNVAVIGCGLIGRRRSKIIAEHSSCSLKWVVDVNAQTAKECAKVYACAWSADWKKVVADPAVDVVVVSTPNFLLAPVGCGALKSGKHVLIEKPMGKNFQDAKKLFQFAKKYHKHLKIGFNHRYHPAIFKAYQLFKRGAIGKLMNIRCQYGHGGRAGYNKEWRGSVQMAGGGELTDQGVHLIDLIQWFCGQTPKNVFAKLQTSFWPIQPAEDNGFALLEFPNGAVASFHSSWTQWKNLFNFEIFGTKGSLSVQGLGGSYGVETLITTLRKPQGGVPDQTEEKFTAPDASWTLEWQDFVNGILKNKTYLGNAAEGLAVMKTLNALYQSYKRKQMVRI